MLLVFVMVLSMTACSTQTNDTNSSDETDNTNNVTVADDNNDAQDDSGGADAKRVAGIWMTFDVAVWSRHSDILGIKLAELGYEYDAYDSAGDSVTQISQIENAVVQGYDAIVIMPVLGEAVADACQKAMDSGVTVVSFVNDSVNHTVYRTTDPEYSGQKMAEYAMEWALDHFPDAEDGSINVALVGEDNDSHNLARWEKIQETVAQYPQANVVAAETVEESIDAGIKVTENIMTQNPNTLINVWICMGTVPFVGINAAIMSESTGYTDEQLSDICLCTSTMDAEFAEVMRQSLTNESVYRVAAANGADMEQNLAELAQVVDDVLSGRDYSVSSPVNTDKITPDNLSDFGY